eukprot:10842024-Ditylum_brightwellii.AAC.1
MHFNTAVSDGVVVIISGGFAVVGSSSGSGRGLGRWFHVWFGSGKGIHFSLCQPGCFSTQIVGVQENTTNKNSN